MREARAALTSPGATEHLSDHSAFFFRIRHPDLLDDSSYVYITASNVQEMNRYEVNGRSTVAMNYSSLPDPTTDPNVKCVVLF